MTIEVVNVASKLSQITEHWSPRIAGELNQQQVKLAKLKGEFVMHQHDDEDELFFVVQGQLFIQLEDRTLEINAGEFVIIPRQTPHKPYAPEEVCVLLFEPATTINTGGVRNEMTRTELDAI